MSTSPNTIQTPVWITATVLAALVFTVVPLPAWLGPTRPAWLALVLIYWHLKYPRRTGFLLSWCCGLLLDGLTGSALGEHALALVIVSFCSLKLAELLRTFPLWQQSIVLIPVLIIYEFVLFWLDGVLGRSAALLWRWLPVFTSAVIWPFMATALDLMNAPQAET